MPTAERVPDAGPREGARSMNRRAVGARLERVAVWLGVLVCWLFAAGLRDVAPAARAPAGGRLELPAGAGTRDAAVRLRCLDADGAPVAGARVELFAIVEEVAHLAAQAQTDREGVARLGGLPRGEAWIRVTDGTHARMTTRLVLERGERPIELTLGPAHGFEVVAVDAEGRPLAGVPIRLYGADPIRFERTTDARGLARFEALGEPPYAVAIEARGFEERLYPELGLEDSPLFVKLEPLGAVEVVVLEPSSTDETTTMPAVGAQVTVAGSGLWPPRRAVTDERGRVRIAGLARGYYQLRAERDELVSEPDIGLLLERGQTETIEIVLEPGLFVTVLVTAAEGDDAPPVRDADVALVEGGISAFPLYGRTGEGGTVVLGPVVGLDATVSARARGFVPRSAVPVDEGESEVTVALSRGGVVTGRAVDEQDFPVEGARIEVLGIDHEGMPIAESSMLASFRDDHFAFVLPGAIPLVPVGELGVMPIVPDIPSEHGPLTVSEPSAGGSPWVSARDGGFRLEPVPPGRIYLIASHPDYVETVTETVRLDVGKEIELEVVLRRGGLLEGRVVEADGLPAAGARVELASLEAPGDRITFAADDGTFAFAAVPADVLLSAARATAMEHVVARVRAQVRPGERTEVEIVLPEPRDPVTVSVVDDRGYPLGRVEVRLTCLDPTTPLRATRFTDESGDAEFDDLSGLALRLVLLRSGHAPAVVELARAPRRIEIAMTAGLAVHGEVREGVGPVEDAAVTLYTPTGVRHARSDGAGEFTLADLAPGSARLLVHKQGYVPWEQRIDIDAEPGRTVELEPVELEASGSVRGLVVDATDEPLAGAWVTVGRVPTYLPLGPLPLGICSTDSAGRFLLRDVEPGTVMLEAYVPGLGRASSEPVAVRASETTEEVRIAFDLVGDEPERVAGPGTLAVTLAETSVRGRASITFEHVPAGGEAERAGIEPGDRLLAVGAARVRTIEQARRLLTGSLSEDLLLTLGRDPDFEWMVRASRERVRR